MNTIAFLGEWGLRSAALVLAGALVLRAFRVKDPSIRLAAWAAMLVGSLSIPVLTTALPKAPVTLAPVHVTALPAIDPVAPAPFRAIALTPAPAPAAPSRRFDWRLAGLALYVAVASGLLLRLSIGIAGSRRILMRGRPTGRRSDGVEILESDAVPAPAVLGIARPAIVLPADWRSWDTAKLEAVVAHERSHIRRRDPAWQFLSAIHRALIWHSPSSWFLHRSLVRAAEDASDDAALAAADRASYAEMLLDFMKPSAGRPPASWGVGMARYSRPEDRIHRILDGTALTRGVTRWTLAVILAIGAPVAYMAAAAAPQTEPPAPPSAPVPPTPPAAPSAPAPALEAPSPPPEPPAPPAPPQDTTTQSQRTIRRYIIVLDNQTTMGSWNSSDATDPDALRSRYGQRFAWMRKTDGSEWVTTDAGVLEEFAQAMRPQQLVNQLQGNVNQEQSKVNDMQGKVNSIQNEVNLLQKEINRRQDLVNRIQNAANQPDNDALIKELQAAIQSLRDSKSDASQNAVNRRQAEVNAEQAKVNQEQQKINAMQHGVNDEQQKVNARFHQRIEEIFQSALDRKLMQRQM